MATSNLLLFLVIGEIVECCSLLAVMMGTSMQQATLRSAAGGAEEAAATHPAPAVGRGAGGGVASEIATAAPHRIFMRRGRRRAAGNPTEVRFLCKKTQQSQEVSFFSFTI